MNSIDYDEVEKRVEENGHVTIAEFYCWQSNERFTSIAEIIGMDTGDVGMKAIEECPDCGRKHWRDDGL